MFTARHYKAIAEVIRTEHDVIDGLFEPDRTTARATLYSVQLLFAARFADDNPRFNDERFAAACEAV